MVTQEAQGMMGRKEGLELTHGLENSICQFHHNANVRLFPGLLVLQVRGDQMGPQGNQEIPETTVSRDPKVPLGHQANQGTPVTLGPKVHQVPLDNCAQEDQLPPVAQGPLGAQASQEAQEIPDAQETMDVLGRVGNQGIRDARVSPAALGALDPQESPAYLVPLEVATTALRLVWRLDIRGSSNQ